MDERFEGGLWCHEVLLQLDLFVEGELSPEALAAVTAHVSACDACARFGSAYAGLVRALRAPPAPDPRDAAPLDAPRLARLRARLRGAG
jgi:anti-sigma factor RsiW